MNEENEVYKKIENVFFKNYHYLGREKLLDAIEGAKLLWSVYEMLAYLRLAKAYGVEKIIAHQPGRIANLFKRIIATF